MEIILGSLLWRLLMINMNIYEIIGLNADPLYEQLYKLKDNKEFKMGRHTIRKSDKFYEVENDDLHEIFKDVIKCYQFISNLAI